MNVLVTTRQARHSSRAQREKGGTDSVFTERPDIRTPRLSDDGQTQQARLATVLAAVLEAGLADQETVDKMNHNVEIGVSADLQPDLPPPRHGAPPARASACAVRIPGACHPSASLDPLRVHPRPHPQPLPPILDRSPSSRRPLLLCSPPPPVAPCAAELHTRALHLDVGHAPRRARGCAGAGEAG